MNKEKEKMENDRAPLLVNEEEEGDIYLSGKSQKDDVKRLPYMPEKGSDMQFRMKYYRSLEQKTGVKIEPPAHILP